MKCCICSVYSMNKCSMQSCPSSGVFPEPIRSVPITASSTAFHAYQELFGTGRVIPPSAQFLFSGRFFIKAEISGYPRKIISQPKKVIQVGNNVNKYIPLSPRPPSSRQKECHKNRQTPFNRTIRGINSSLAPTGQRGRRRIKCQPKHHPPSVIFLLDHSFFSLAHSLLHSLPQSLVTRSLPCTHYLGCLIICPLNHLFTPFLAHIVFIAGLVIYIL